MWAKHDVSRAPLPPRHHLQPQHLPGLLALTHLLPPRGEYVSTVFKILLSFVLWSFMAYLWSFIFENKGLEVVRRSMMNTPTHFSPSCPKDLQ